MTEVQNKIFTRSSHIHLRLRMLQNWIWKRNMDANVVTVIEIGYTCECKKLSVVSIHAQIEEQTEEGKEQLRVML